MNDTRRRILELVVEGRLTAPEAASILADQSPAELLAMVLDEPIPGSIIERLEIIGTGAQVTIIGDAGVADIEISGPHTIRNEDGAAIVETGGPGQQQYFSIGGTGATFGQGEAARISAMVGASGAGRPQSGPVPLMVRANPELPLAVSVTAGGLAVEGMSGAIRCESISSTSAIRDIRGPLTAIVNAGSLTAEGWFAQGESHIECSMGSLRVGLRPDADCHLHINEELGRVKVELPEAADGPFKPVDGQIGHNADSQASYVKEWVVGAGAGGLVVEANMAEVTISQSTPGLADTAELDEPAGAVGFGAVAADPSEGGHFAAAVSEERAPAADEEAGNHDPVDPPDETEGAAQ